MKHLIFTIILSFSSFLFSQDKLITLSGAEYSGTYVGVKGEKVEFIQSGQSNSVFVPKVSVVKVILSDGQIMNFSNVSSETVVENNNQKLINNNPNDKLTAVNGKSYYGKYINNNDGKIEFTKLGEPFPMLVPINSVKNVVSLFTNFGLFILIYSF